MNLLQGLGQAKPVSEFINTAMQYQTTQAALETQRLQQQKLAADLQKQQQEQQHLDQVVNFKLSPFYLSLPDEAKPAAEKMYQGAGAVDSNFFGKRRDMLAVTNEMASNKNAFESIMKPVVDAKNQMAIKAYEKWQKNPQDKQLESEYNVARAEAERAGGTYWKHVDKLQEISATASSKQDNQPLEKVETPTGPTLVPRSQAIGMTPYSPDKVPNEVDLTRKALAGDKESQAILDAMQGRKVAIQKAGAEATQASKMEGMDLNSLADSLANGQMASEHVRNAFGVPIQGKVETLVRQKYKNFDFVKNDANSRFQQNPGNMRTIAMAEAALPRLTMLDDQVGKLGNTDIPKINEVMRLVARETGRPEYTNFAANRNAIVQEINTALSGSATSSDLRVRIELENIQSARSPAQILGAIHNLREALISRLDTSLAVPYPIEVVQGKKTLPEYKDQMFKKYRGKYGSESAGGAGNWVFKNGAWVQE